MPDSPEQAEREAAVRLSRTIMEGQYGVNWTVYEFLMPSGDVWISCPVETRVEAAIRAAGRAEAAPTSRRTFEGYQEALARALAAEERIEALEGALREYREAMRDTREYVGEGLLPALPGWSWFDADERARALLLQPAEGPASEGDEGEASYREHQA